MPYEIVIDNREMGSDVVSALSKYECVLIPRQLDVADYILSERVGVERKTLSDFYKSIIDTRLFNQLKALKGAFARPILIIEDNDVFKQINSKILYGTLASIIVDFAIPVIRTKDANETAEIIFTIAKREQSEKPHSRPQIRQKMKFESLREQQVYLICGLPNVSTERAEALLRHFKSPEKIFTADIEKLTEVPNIGEKIAKRIREVLTSET
jgi:Fanconi anemia group M protein